MTPRNKMATLNNIRRNVKNLLDGDRHERKSARPEKRSEGYSVYQEKKAVSEVYSAITKKRKPLVRVNIAYREKKATC